MPPAIPGLCSSAMTNRNVKIFYAFNGLQSLGRGIWMGNILSLYIVLLAESSSGILGLTPNELLGATSAVTGVALLISVLPGGFLADKWSIRGTLLLGAVVGTAGLAVLLMSAELVGIVVGMFLWGMFQGFSRPAAEAMLANSTVSGDRSGIYARAHLIDQLGMGTGPLLNILLFLYLGDVWELSVLRSVMSVGIGLSFLSTLVILAMRKSDMLGDESEALPGAEPVNESTQAVGSDSLAQDGEGAKPGRIRQLLQRRPGAKYIPHIFLASSFIIGFGAGMTVKFFPVFFRDIYQMRPIAVQLVMGSGLLLTGAATVLAQKLSRSRGRAEMILILQALSISALVGLAFYPSIGLMVALFLVRGALMNATTPLSRSIVMDYVSKKQRGIWSSLQTVAWGLFWNVSALLGGFLIGDDNFRLCFLITAGIYVLGTSIIIPLVPMIHREGAQAKKAT
jgi:MFS family permease